MSAYLNAAKLSCAALLAFCSTMPPATAAIFEGHHLNIAYIHQTVSGGQVTGDGADQVLVGPGVELHEFGRHEIPVQPGFVDIDIADTRITVTLLSDQPTNFGAAFNFTNTNNESPTIFQWEIDPATTWAGFAAQPLRLNVVGANVQINVSGLSGLAGQQVVADFGIPEPAGAALAALGLGGLGLLRRRAIA